MTTPKNLPIELHDMILDAALHSFELPAVSTLTTVCQHWRLKLHRHTFAALHLRQSTVLSFSRLLESPFSCACILPSISDLYIYIRRFKGDCPEILALNHVLSKVSPHPNLQSLNLSRENERNIVTGLANITPHCFPFVSTLRLHHIMFLDPANFVYLFEQLPTLKHVDFEGVFVNWTIEDTPPRLPPGDFSLALVVFNVTSKRTRIKWTLADGPLSITSEDLYCLSWLLRADTAPLLRTIGPALRELDIDLQLGQLDGSSLSAVERALDLSSTPSLHLIRIGSSKHVLSFINWVPGVLYRLAKTNSTTLKVLEICFASSRQFHLDKPFLRCITQGLCTPQYSAIRKIQFVAFHDDPLDKDIEQTITQSIQTELLHYHEMGLLRITFSMREKRRDAAVAA